MEFDNRYQAMHLAEMNRSTEPRVQVYENLQHGDISGDSSRGRKEKQTWARLLKDYTQETTLHGLRYITADSEYRSRRFVWLLVLLLTIAIFALLVTTKLQYYYKYPTVVDVSVDYADRLPFPAVTICNQNKFRLTALQKMGLYDVIVSQYGEQTGSFEHQEISGDIYHIRPSICEVDSRQNSYVTVEQTTSGACQYLCSHLLSDECSGVLFDFEQKTCILTSFTGDHVVGNNRSEMCSTSKKVFYRRERMLVKQEVYCDFEGIDPCLLITNSSQPEEWKRLAGNESTPPERDHTVAIEGVHYMSMLATDLRENYTARLHTDFLQTDNRCLLLFYKFYGDGTASINVYVVKEDLVEKLIWRVEYSEKTHTWVPLHVHLPGGIHQVVIEGWRGAGFTGIAVDDVRMRTCSEPDTCVRSALGSEYLGRTDRSSNGHVCISWTKAHSLLAGDLNTIMLPDVTMDDANNYCRNIDSSGNGPWCITEKGTREHCAVPRCECPSEGWFKCTNGRCIPLSLTCDGTDDCMDRSDETVNCRKSSTIACDFEEPFICGYYAPRENVMFWVQQSHSKDNFDLLLKTEVGSASMFGDVALLHSPIQNFGYPTMVSFLLDMNVDDTEAATKLQVFLTWQGMTFDPVVSFQRSSYGRQRFCVPPGDYSITFAFMLGYSSNPSAMVDRVKVEPAPDLASQENYTVYGRSDFKHSRDAYSYLEDFISCDLECGLTYFDTEGLIESEVYPMQIFDPIFRIGAVGIALSDCSATISTVNGSQTTLKIFGSFLPCSDVQVQIFSISGDELTLSVCGLELKDSPAEVVIPSSKFMVIEFYNGNYVDYSGYMAEYKTTLLPSVDYVMAASYRGQEQNRWLQSWLTSPRLLLSGSQCMEVDLYTINAFSIMISSNDMPLLDHNDVLWRTRAGLGKAWHHVALDLDLPNKTGFYYFVFESSYWAGNASYTAAVDNIKIYNGTCKRQVVEDANPCRFSSIQQCGYVDNTAGTNKWMRARDEFDGYSMVAAFHDFDRPTHALLMSPLLSIAGDTCVLVSLAYNTSYLEFTIGISYSEAISDDQQLSMFKFGDLMDVNKVDKVKSRQVGVSLATGTYHVVFRAFGNNGYVRIQQVEKKEGLCENASTSGVSDAGELEIKDAKTDTKGSGLDGDLLASNLNDIDTPTDGTRASGLGDSKFLSKAEERDFLLELMDVGLDELVMNTSHKMEDMILGCTWRKKPCPSHLFQQVYTDAGYCFQFNGDNFDPLSSSTPGRQHGLKMAMNLQQYEYVEEMAKEAGVQVLLHSQNETYASIVDLGFVVPPGLHSRVIIGYTLGTYLPSPYGRCGSRELKHYPNDTEYSYTRCQLDHQTTDMLETCDCREVYMPGEERVCSLKDRLDCNFTVGEEHGLGVSQCPASCETLHHPTSLSFAALSSKGAKDSIFDHWNEVSADYKVALTTKERADKTTFHVTLNAMKKVILSLQKLQRILTTQFVDPRTSIVKRVEKGLFGITEIARQDWQSFSTRLETAKKLSETFIKPNTERVQMAMEKEKAVLLQLSNLIQNYQIRPGGETYYKTSDFFNNCDAHNFGIMLEIKEYRELQRLLRRVDSTFMKLEREVEQVSVFFSAMRSLDSWKDYTEWCRNDKNATHLYLPQMLTLRDGAWGLCSDPTTSMLNYNQEILLALNSSRRQSEIGMMDKSEMIDLKDKFYPLLDQFQSHSGRVMKCFNEFTVLIDEMQAGISSKATSPKIVSDVQTMVALLKPIQRFSDQIESAFEKYMLGVQTQHEIFEWFNGIKDRVFSSLGSFQFEIGQKLFAPVSTHLSGTEELLRKKYYESLRNSRVLASYYNISGVDVFKQALVAAKIWMKPRAQMNSATVVSFLQKKDEAMSLAERVIGLGDGRNPYVTILNDYFQDIRDGILPAEENLFASIHAAEQSVKEYHQLLVEFQTRNAGDKDFLKENILQLDIFYGELKEEIVQQKKEYTITAFFSDMGGFLGLLLGASALTICEVLDLLVYNALVKYRNSAKN